MTATAGGPAGEPPASPTGPRRRDGLLAVALGLAAVLTAFPGAVAGRVSLVPGAVLAGDPVHTPDPARRRSIRAVWEPGGVLGQYPAEVLTVRELRAGRAPLWNPHVGAGIPNFVGPLAPLLLPYVLHPTERTYTWHLLLRIVVALAATFALARGRGASRPGAAVAAAAFALGGYAATRYGVTAEGSGVALMPLVALAADRVVARARGGVGALGLAVGAMIHSAHPSTAVIATGGALLLAGLAAPRDLRAWRRLAAGGLLGAGVGALFVLAVGAYLAGGSTYKALPHLAALLLPDTRILRAVPDVLRFGAGPLLLAAVALAQPRRDRTLAALARGAAVLAVLAGVAFAAHLAIRSPARWFLPPRHALVLVVLPLALLAGSGLDLLLEPGGLAPRARRLAGAALGATAAWLLADALTGWRLHRVPDVVAGDLAAALAVAIALGVMAAGSVRARRIAAPALAAVIALGLLASTRRAVLEAGTGVPDVPAGAALTAPGRAAPAPTRIAGLENHLLPNLATALGLADVRYLGPVMPRRYRAYWALVPRAVNGPTQTLLLTADSPLLDLLGVERIVARPALIPPGWPVRWRAGDVAVADNPRAAPRAFIPTEVRAAADPGTAFDTLEALAAAGRLPQAAVVEAPRDVAAAVARGAGTVRIEEYHPGRVVLVARAEAPSLVVLTDTYAPGWRARVDGAPARIHATDLLFRGVVVPAGEHRVVLEYRPGWFRPALAINAASLLLALALAARGLGRDRRPGG